MTERLINQRPYAIPAVALPAQARVLRSARTAKGAWIFVDGHVYFVAASQKRACQSGAAQMSSGNVISPMPGKIFRVLAKVGDVVQPGQDLLVLEAMKMEHTLTAPLAGKIVQCDVKVGDLVELGQVLVVIQ